ncbi:hypothetical protein B0T10DRAFT_609698 [Thelonectria olida]|uniref:Uncharacterized protein n=1 Tax=Thelonectria olida TaxID=1576542 RepID=A0A9P8VW36_9HYPO|nr:hypothetical protein B0T10DRAFT_609698 [Thelonectria olida]
MPSTTAFFGDLVTNFGPLTTTYTAPASCYTGTEHVYYGNASNLANIQGQPTCSIQPYGDCMPSGTLYDSLVAHAWATPSQAFVNYYSPGLVCPSGWTTAGAFARDGETGFKSSGVFTQDPYPRGNARYLTPPARQLAGKDVWEGVLKESETLAYCCPSGYTAAISGAINGACWSSLGPFEEFDYSSNCYVFLPDEALVTVESFDGSTWTPPLLSITPATNALTTHKQELSDEWAVVYTDWDILTMVPAVPLVFQPTDTASASKGEDAEESSGKDESDDDNAAAIGLSGPGLVQLGAVLVSMFVGAGLLVAW